MGALASQVTKSETAPSPWHGFRTGLWQKAINVRDFIQENYEPYDGDETFLAPATTRTTNLWDTLNALFVEERKKGVLDISPIPSSITAHAPGYIDRTNEIIVGLQTEAPLKRAIMPNGGFRLVASAIEGLRIRAGSARRGGIHQVPQDAQRRRLRRLHRRRAAMPQFARAHRTARRVRTRPDHR